MSCTCGRLPFLESGFKTTQSGTHWHGAMALNCISPDGSLINPIALAPLHWKVMHDEAVLGRERAAKEDARTISGALAGEKRAKERCAEATGERTRLLVRVENTERDLAKATDQIKAACRGHEEWRVRALKAEKQVADLRDRINSGEDLLEWRKRAADAEQKLVELQTDFSCVRSERVPAAEASRGLGGDAGRGDLEWRKRAADAEQKLVELQTDMENRKRQAEHVRAGNDRLVRELSGAHADTAHWRARAGQAEKTVLQLRQPLGGAFDDWRKRAQVAEARLCELLPVEEKRDALAQENRVLVERSIAAENEATAMAAQMKQNQGALDALKVDLVRVTEEKMKERSLVHASLKILKRLESSLAIYDGLLATDVERSLHAQCVDLKEANRILTTEVHMIRDSAFGKETEKELANVLGGDTTVGDLLTVYRVVRERDRLRKENAALRMPMQELALAVDDLKDAEAKRQIKGAVVFLLGLQVKP